MRNGDRCAVAGVSRETIMNVDWGHRTPIRPQGGLVSSSRALALETRLYSKMLIDLAIDMGVRRHPSTLSVVRRDL